jgi:hypothetical protein
MPAGESASHARLKVLALAWAQANGLAIAAPEVRMPRSGFRVDVAACGRGSAGRTAVFECKQARSDLLKDSHAEQPTRHRLAELVQRRAALEAMMSTHRPDLRRGESLFPEFDALDFGGFEHRTYRGVLARIGTLQARMLRGTKFSRMVRYRCADLLYLVSEQGIFAAAEIPAGWGLLVRADDQLVLERPPAALDSAPEQRAALLESIALAATRAVNRAAGISVTFAEQPTGWTREVQVAGMVVR